MKIHHKYVSLIYLIFLLIMNIGCTYTENVINIIPLESEDWTPSWNYRSKFPKLSYTCGSFHIEARYIIIESTMYTVGPLLPIIPMYQKTTPPTNKRFLQLEIVLSSGQSYDDVTELSSFNAALSDQSIYIEIYQNPRILKPISYHVQGIRKKREIHTFVFDVVPKSIDKFKLVFAEPVGNCLVPPLIYEYKDFGLGLNIMVN